MFFALRIVLCFSLITLASAQVHAFMPIDVDEEDEDSLTFIPKSKVPVDTISNRQIPSVIFPSLDIDTTTFILSDYGIVKPLGEFLVIDSFTGRASYYADYFHGRRTSCGEIYCRDSLTAAHRTLPFGTLLRITNTCNDNTVIVRVNDRGPFIQERCVDVSKKAAIILGMISSGTAHVKIEIVERMEPIQEYEE